MASHLPHSPSPLRWCRLCAARGAHRALPIRGRLACGRLRLHLSHVGSWQASYNSSFLKPFSPMSLFTLVTGLQEDVLLWVVAFWTRSFSHHCFLTFYNLVTGFRESSTIPLGAA